MRIEHSILAQIFRRVFMATNRCFKNSTNETLENTTQLMEEQLKRSKKMLQEPCPDDLDLRGVIAGNKDQLAKEHISSNE